MEREQTWIRAIQRRNSREAAEQLIQTYYDEIYRFVYRQTGSKEDAMDLTQSVFIAVLRALPATGRSGRPSAPGCTASPPTKSSTPAGRPGRSLFLFRKWSSLQQRTLWPASMTGPCWRPSKAMSPAWTPGEQAVFRLRIYGEKTFPEIAAAMGEPEAAVKSRYYRLIGRLRKEFGADG